MTHVFQGESADSVKHAQAAVLRLAKIRGGGPPHLATEPAVSCQCVFWAGGGVTQDKRGGGGVLISVSYHQRQLREQKRAAPCVFDGHGWCVLSGGEGVVDALLPVIQVLSLVPPARFV